MSWQWVLNNTETSFVTTLLETYLLLFFLLVNDKQLMTEKNAGKYIVYIIVSSFTGTIIFCNTDLYTNMLTLLMSTSTGLWKGKRTLL